MVWENAPGPSHNFISGCSAVGSAPALGAGCRRFESCHSDHDGVTRKMSHHFFSIHVLFSVIIDGWVEVDIRRNCHCIDTRHNISGSTALSDMVNYGK